MDSTYQYKAFISYRHTARDKAIAEKLQRWIYNTSATVENK